MEEGSSISKLREILKRNCSIWSFTTMEIDSIPITSCSKEHQGIYQEWFSYADSGTFLLFCHLLIFTARLKPSVWLPRKVNNINARFWIWHCKFYIYRNGLFMYERCFFQMEMAVFLEMMLLSSSLCRICPGKISSRFDFLIFRSISCYFFVDQSWFQLNW